MQLLPFYRKVYRSEMEIEELSSRLKRNINAPSWKLDFSQISFGNENQKLAGRIKNKSFLLGRGINSLTLGTGGFYPLLKGNLKTDRINGNTLLTILIRPSYFAMVVLIFFNLIAIFAFATAIQKQMHEVLIVCSLFFVSTYLVVMFCFNYLKKRYISFIENIILSPI